MPKIFPPGDVAEMMRPHESTRGPVEQAQLDGAAHRDALVVVAAHVAHRGDPRGEQLGGRAGEDEIAELAGARILAVQEGRRPETRAAAGVAGEVDMRVDQARQQRAAAGVHRTEGRILAADALDPLDAAARERDGHPVTGRRPIARDHADVPEQRGVDGHPANDTQTIIVTFSLAMIQTDRGRLVCPTRTAMVVFG